MTDLELVISGLREKIAQKRRELDEQEQALTLLEKLAGTTGSGPLTAIAQDMGVIRLDELDLMEHAGKRRGTLLEDVTDVVKRLGDQEFSIVHIDTLLKKMGKVPEDKSVRSRISSMLSKLEEDGELERTFTGKGNVPHRYRRKQGQFDLNEL